MKYQKIHMEKEYLIIIYNIKKKKLNLQLLNKSKT